jgi:hypothetical protein
MMPIIAEAHINMVIITFCKDEIRNDRAQYETFTRAKSRNASICYRGIAAGSFRASTQRATSMETSYE